MSEGKALGLIGAPTSAGAFAPGQEDAPDALRRAGLVGALKAAGAVVEDLGDTPRVRWRPDRTDARAMNIGAVREGALAIADRVAEALARGLVPLVIGGDCTVELGTVAAWNRRHDRASLVYFDPHPDLNTPTTSRDGALDWMGLAHLLGEPGARPELVDLGGTTPALRSEDVLLFGHDPVRATPQERDVMARRGLSGIDQSTVAADPTRAALRAVEWTASRGRFLLHLDVDAIDFADLPIAENTDRNVGLSFSAAAAACDVLGSSPALGGVTVTEINPHHGEPDGQTLASFVERLAPALAGRRTA